MYFVEEKIKYMEFIQNIIARLSTHSFTLKGLCISIIAGVLAFSFDTLHTDKALLILVIPIFSLWFLDSYFLQLERKYRILYDRVRGLSPNNINFSLELNGISPYPKYLKCLFSKTEFFYYGALFVFILVFTVITNYI